MLAGAQEIVRIEEIQEIPGVHDRAVGAEISGSVLHELSGEEDAWEGLVGDTYPGIGLGVLQQYVVLRFVLLDKIVFEQQCVRFRIHDRILDFYDFRDKYAGLGVQTLRRHEILMDTFEEILRLAHINNRSRGIIIPVNTRGVRQ